MSKDAHEQIVAPLRQRLAECEIERKKAQDEMIRLLGGKPYNYPQAESEPAAIEEPEPDQEQSEAEWLGYLAKNRPSEFAPALARVMARDKARTFQPPPQVSAAFDQAAREVAENTNGHHAATTT